MHGPALIDPASTDRDLVRRLRAGTVTDTAGVMPESLAWHLFLELRRRGEPSAVPLFLKTLRTLHARRSLGAVPTPNDDISTDEHRLVESEDPFLADLWKAYKRCIQNNRPGPASHLLRDIQERLGG
ncbi:MAG: hypothetical protein EA397_08250 [Deltaproteobacteria bacterium]|nr:MAG: hypothetical protein EA397_08250 [Deltaproteobacteria bacterium]